MSVTTQVLRVGDDPMQDPAVDQAVRLLRAGETVAFPTETVYGLGADATSTAAVEAVYAAKGRPADNPLIVHIGEAGGLNAVAQCRDRRVKELIDRFWPGPLTLVLKARPPLIDTVCRGLDTVAVRLPDNPVAQALIVQAGFPVAAPSANRSGRPSPTTAEHVREDLEGRIPLILDGGPCRLGLESTVLDLTVDPARILRPGSITGESLEETLGERLFLGADPNPSGASPGTRYLHYRPKAPLYLVGAEVSDERLAQHLHQLTLEHPGGPVGYLGRRSRLRTRPGVLTLPLRCDSEEVARSLYADIRHLDREGAALILVDAPAPSGLGASLLDRLERASTGRIPT